MRMMRWLQLGVLAASLLLATAGFAASLQVREPLGLSRAAWPITTGVPFARGQVRDPTRLALRARGGHALPVQTRVLSRWDDQSVRWLLVDFPLRLDAHTEQALELVPGRPTSAAPRVQVHERANGIEIDTGPLRFRVPRNEFAIAQDVRLNQQALLNGPVRVFAATVGQNPREPNAPRTLIVRDRGPIRAEIEWRGSMLPGLDYVARVHAYAGQPFMRVFFSFVATGPDEFVGLQQLGVDVPLAFDAPRYRFGIEEKESAAGAINPSGLTLIQDDNLHYRLNGDARDGRTAGWIETHGKRGGVGIASRFFWQEYPQSFEVHPRQLRYHLWASDTAAQIGVGAANTHEFTLYFFTQQPPPRYAEALVHPGVVQLDPKEIVASGALPNAVAPDGGTSAFLQRLSEAFSRVVARNAAEEWDEAAQVKCPPPGRERRRTGAFGMLNWGDWNYPGFHDTTKGCDAWGNLEYDLTQVYALGFAATGRTDYFDTMTAAARHFMDVDVIHAHPARPKWIGMNHPKNPLHFSFERGGVDLGHTWTEGLISYYYLTGDERALESARGIADFLTRRLKAGMLRGNPRQWGWPQVALLAVYRATGDAQYEQAALAYAMRGMAAASPTDLSHWKVGILADALAATHAATHDPAIERWLRAYAAAVVAKPDRDQRFYPAVAYVARLARDAELAHAARAAVEHAQFGNWAKPFTITGRTGFRILALLGES